jgi:uncharacterized membrane protein
MRCREDTISNFVVVILPDNASADLAATSLETLHAAGSIALFAMARLVREADGTISSCDSGPAGPLSAAVHTLAAALVQFGSGLAGSGSTLPGRSLAILAEFADLGVDVDIMEETCAAMDPGARAVVAEIGEHWLAPVDGVAAAVGAVIVRRRRTDVAAQQLNQDIKALDAELKELELEADRLGASAAFSIRSRANATRARLQGATRRAEMMLARLHDETEVKMAALHAQMERAGLELDQKIGSKERIRKALAQTRSEVRRRSDVLAQSVAIARKALGSAAD